MFGFICTYSRVSHTQQWKQLTATLCEIIFYIQQTLTGDTFRVLLYVQLNRMASGGSASTSQRTGIECILIAPTDVCSVPGLQRGATVINFRMREYQKLFYRYGSFWR